MNSLILAGGRSKRMGRDKSLIERPDGIRQLDYIAQLVRDAGPAIHLSSNDPTVSLPGIKSIPDSVPGCGPLGAFSSFLGTTPDPTHTLVVSCDLFLLDAATLRHLIDHRSADHSATCYANRIDGRPEPLCAIYSAEALAKAATFLDANQRCARHFIESLSPKILELPNPAALDNANTIADLDEAFAKLTHGVTAKSLKVLYFAKLREERQLDEEQVDTLACTAAGLYDELSFRHRFTLRPDSLRVAINGDFADWSTLLHPDDEIVFIPPVAGG